MKRLSKLLARKIRNQTIIREERRGYGPEYVVGHSTYIADPEVRRAIAKLAIENIIA